MDLLSSSMYCDMEEPSQRQMLIHIHESCHDDDILENTLLFCGNRWGKLWIVWQVKWSFKVSFYKYIHTYVRMIAYHSKLWFPITATSRNSTWIYSFRNLINQGTGWILMVAAEEVCLITSSFFLRIVINFHKKNWKRPNSPRNKLQVIHSEMSLIT